MKKQLSLFAAAALFLSVLMVPAEAVTPNTTGNEFETATQGKVAAGVVQMCLDSTGTAVPCGNGSAKNAVSGTTAAMTGTASTQLIAAVASQRIYLTDLTCGNSHATVGTFVNVQDGSGGTTLWTLPAAAVYGGAVVRFQTPVFSSSGNGIYVVDATTGANVICSGSGFSGN